VPAGRRRQSQRFPLGIDADGSVIVRPDHVIAWQTRTGSPDTHPVLTPVLTDALSDTTRQATGA
jgi:hypothetical protein